ncbi:hypothetical protein IFM89_002198, partial [Coptis chinensis]
ITLAYISTLVSTRKVIWHQTRLPSVTHAAATSMPHPQLSLTVLLHPLLILAPSIAGKEDNNFSTVTVVPIWRAVFLSHERAQFKQILADKGEEMYMKMKQGGKGADNGENHETLADMKRKLE